MHFFKTSPAQAPLDPAAGSELPDCARKWLWQIWKTWLLKEQILLYPPNQKWIKNFQILHAKRKHES